MKRSLETSAADTEEDDVELALRVKWGSSTYPVELTPTSTVADLKNMLFQLTEVLPKRQKVLGLSRGASRLPEDTVQLSALSLKPDQQLMLIGSREADISSINAAQDHFDSIVNDLDVDYDNDGDVNVLDPSKKPANRRKLERRIASTEFRIINPLRDGKKLLVLDLDYTLFDCRSVADNFHGLARPGLHEFLASVYRYYDIVVWSQTSWRWLEAKLTELSMLSSDEYKLAFVLDRSSMFQISSRRNKVDVSHEVKALEIIWRKFPERWSPANTIHIDDLSKNFALNPQSGLKISAFKNAPVTRLHDRELYRLERYLIRIAETESDFSTLKHKYWKRYCALHNAEPQPGAP